MLKKIGLPGLLIGGAILYFLTRPKAPAPAPMAPPAPIPQPKKSAMQQCLDNPSAKNCAAAGTGILDAIASEFRGMDGMIPATLNGHMSELGAFSGLGGTFYGGV